MENKLTRHHLIPRNVGVNQASENIVKWKDYFHRAFHIIFAGKEPTEQIRHLLELNDSVIQGDFKADLLKVLDLYKGLEYHDGIKKIYKTNKHIRNII